MRIAGIDPGLGGAIALLDGAGNFVQVIDMPIFRLKRGGRNRSEVDAHVLADLMEEWRPGHAFLEQVWSWPGEAMASASAREGYGVIKGVLAASGVPYTLISSQKWKRDLWVPAAKDGARARASQLLPAAAANWTRVKDDGRAEAALIGLWGVRLFNAIATGQRVAVGG